jgi:hypothetical protein
MSIVGCLDAANRAHIRWMAIVETMGESGNWRKSAEERSFCFSTTAGADKRTGECYALDLCWRNRKERKEAPREH